MPVSQMNSIGLLIPVHNRLEYTKECLKDLERHRNKLFFTCNTVFTIIIDDGSTDGTNIWIKENYPEVIVLHGNGSLWWSGSMNLGAKYALEKLKCDFVLTWENDISPFPEYFDNLQFVINNLKEGQIACSKIYYKINSTRIFAMGGIFNTRSGYKDLIGRQENDSEEYQQEREVDWFCGQGILINKSVFARIGFFDEKVFPQYYGDADFALRAKKSGFRNLVFPGLKLTNDTSTTGISHIKNKSIGQFIESFFSIRSNANIIKDIQFYKRHATSILAYNAILKRQFRYIGGFIKWKILGMFGIQRKHVEFY
jgi:GT2 family glycosyltransferase